MPQWSPNYCLSSILVVAEHNLCGGKAWPAGLVLVISLLSNAGPTLAGGSLDAQPPAARRIPGPFPEGTSSGGEGGWAYQVQAARRRASRHAEGGSPR